MLINLFQTVRASGVPCSLRELLDLLGALEKQLVYANIDDFYYLSRAILVKDEKHYDKFDKAFDIYFKGIEKLEDIFQALIPEDWLRKAFEKELDPEELKKIKSLGGLDKLLEEFKKRLEEQKDRHEGGNKWVGTNGTSPFGHGGQNPEGIRVGGEGGQKSAVKVWEQRQYSNLDDSIIIGTREMKMALRRLRKFARHGNDLELDMDGTIKSTAKNAGYLDIRMVPERSNAVKVIVLFDVGGSMDPYIKLCEELFSAIKTEFKHLEYLYTVPVFGFESPEDYWKKASSKPYLSKIKLPTLLINAEDDSFLGKECFPYEEAGDSETFFLEVTKYGGHVGFLSTFKQEESR